MAKDKKQDCSEKIQKIFSKRFLIPIGVVILVYLLSFLLFFNIFGLPTRNSYGWLGPPLYDEDRVKFCYGDVYVYEKDEEILIYKLYYPLCKFWLLLNVRLVLLNR